MSTKNTYKSWLIIDHVIEEDILGDIILEEDITEDITN